MAHRNIMLVAIIIAIFFISGCSGKINQAGKQVHDEQCRVERDGCDSLCNQQPDSEQTGCKAKCDGDYYTCENTN